MQPVLPYLETVKPPSDDKRWKIVAARMRTLGNQRSALIEALHAVQQAFGYLDKAGLTFVAATLRVPLSRVYGVATFYHFFTMEPPAKHTCAVCTGTACHIKGAGRLLETIAEHHHVKPGETTPGGELSIFTARCFGICGLAPLAVVDGVVSGWVTPDSLEQRLAGVLSDVA